MGTERAMTALKKTKRELLKGILLIPAAILTPLIILVELWLVFLGVTYLYDQINRNQIRSEIFSYVQKNVDRIELTNSSSYEEFFYTATGLQDGGVEYGYYYSPNDDHTLHGEPYRKGYRTHGIPDDRTDWFYSERICENWFYYEIHDG